MIKIKYNTAKEVLLKYYRTKEYVDKLYFHFHSFHLKLKSKVQRCVKYLLVYVSLRIALIRPTSWLHSFISWLLFIERTLVWWVLPSRRQRQQWETRRGATSTRVKWRPSSRHPLFYTVVAAVSLERSLTWDDKLCRWCRHREQDSTRQSCEKGEWVWTNRIGEERRDQWIRYGITILMTIEKKFKKRAS